MSRPPATLYYHLRQLEDAGLVRAVGERATGKRPETLYEAVGTHLRLTPTDPEEEAWYAELERYVRVTLRDIERAIAQHVEAPGFDRDDPAPTMHFRAAQFRIGADDRRELARRIAELTDFLGAADARASQSDPDLSLTIAVAPTDERQPSSEERAEAEAQPAE